MKQPSVALDVKVRGTPEQLLQIAKKVLGKDIIEQKLEGELRYTVNEEVCPSQIRFIEVEPGIYSVETLSICSVPDCPNFARCLSSDAHIMNAFKRAWADKFGHDTLIEEELETKKKPLRPRIGKLADLGRS